MLSFCPSLPSFWLFLCFLLAPFSLPFIAAQQNAFCAPSGVWGDWDNWSSCAPNLNIQRRIRPCNAQPVGCTPSIPFNCSGTYSEVKQCDGGGTNSSAANTWNAQMLQSMSISRQLPGGALPPGTSFNAAMMQAMNINDTFGR